MAGGAEVEGWVLYEAPGGGAVVAKEIRRADLTAFQVARLEAAMRRVARSDPLPGDLKLLRGDLWEVRVRAGGVQLRLFFVACQGEGTTFLPGGRDRLGAW